jgi:tetratricopeptide (TPR) repeat protein
MARSFYRLTQERAIEDFTRGNVFYHKASDSYFTMLRREGKYYQRRHQTGLTGEPVNVVEKEIHFVIGSGNHVRTYLTRTNRDRLVELPLAWYAEKGGHWGMNPGYDRPDHMGFRRTVSYQCMFCHNAYPDAAATEAAGAAHFDGRIPEGINCQRCHGPGGKHVQAAQTPAARLEDIRAAIVNPSRLTIERQMEVCMQCHLESTSFHLPNSIWRFDRPRFSYEPGKPLGDFVLFFDHARGTGRDDKFEIASAAYRLRRSACFQRSAGKLLCTSCHNAHNIQRGDEAARHVVSVCRQCHSSAIDRLRASDAHPPGDDCVSCHMPKRRTEDVIHAVVTDHYIQRRKPERDLLAPLAERHETAETAYRGEVIPYYPQPLPDTAENELYVSVAQVIQQSNLIDGIGRLSAAIELLRPDRAEFYFYLADAWRDSGQLEKALPLYEHAVQRQPNSVGALHKLGESLRSARQPERATAILKQALEAAPDYEASWYELGMAYVDQGKLTEAIACFRKAAELDPDRPDAHNSLGAAWLQRGDAAKAEAALRTAIRIRPDFAEAHNNLGGVLSSAGNLRQACFHFEAAIRYRPDFPAARYNYGLALARLRRFDEAQLQIESGLRAEPNNAEAHQVLGALLAGKGQKELAIQHYREALRIRPEFGRAHVGLAGVLADSGDREGAELHLRKAAASSDPSARAQAEIMLRRLGNVR